MKINIQCNLIRKKSLNKKHQKKLLENEKIQKMIISPLNHLKIIKIVK